MNETIETLTDGTVMHKLIVKRAGLTITGTYHFYSLLGLWLGTVRWVDDAYTMEIVRHNPSTDFVRDIDVIRAWVLDNMAHSPVVMWDFFPAE